MSHYQGPLVLALAGATLLLGAILAGPAGAAGRGVAIDEAKEYAECMTLARAEPEAAFESALAWQGLGGGEPARHCAAVALIGIGRYAQAALRLEELAQDMGAAAKELRADVLAQTGQAWLMAGNSARAHAAQSAALALDPDNVEILADRSITLATAESYWEAVDDLNQALELAPGRADLLVMRATAYRYLDALGLARDDVDRALALDPGNPDGLVERGVLRRIAGDAAGARDDWLRVLERADGTPAADSARANLEKLDVKTE
jgi:tetratricopeptide (TPR) repeat protein